MKEQYELVNRMAVITMLVNKKPEMGRTALMKYMYLLQVVKSVPLQYRFQLYAYGPYDSSVLNDLGTAEAWGAVEESLVQYQSGYGYKITAGPNAQVLLDISREFLQEHEAAIDWLVENFGKYAAADLELIGTMVWADREAKRANERRSIDELVKLVLEIKPRFSRDHARAIADELKNLDVLISTA